MVPDLAERQALERRTIVEVQRLADEAARALPFRMLACKAKTLCVPSLRIS